MVELRIALQDKQKDFRDKIDSWPVVGFGGARGGGKSYGLRNIHLIRRIEYPGSTGVIFRKTYPELEANHIEPLFKQFPALKEYYNESKKVLKLPNGSSEQFCHCDSMRDVGLYQGREYQDFAYEEAGDITEDVFQALRASNRTSNPAIPARAQLTANPGGLGHSWIKRLFITKRYKPHEKASDYFWIQSLLRDNPALTDADPDYQNRLLAQCNETLRRAWLEGDWDVEAGQFFSDLDRSVHVIEPIDIPKHWNRFGAYDYGYNHPACWLWFAVDEDGVVCLYRELIAPHLAIDEQAAKVLEFPDSRSITFWAGHDCWATKKAGDPTIAEDFLRYGVRIKKANIDRKQGASQVRMFLRRPPEKVKQKNPGPRVRLFKTCPVTYDCLTRMIHDPNNVEDVLKVDAVEGDIWTGDDAYDAFRYGLMSRPRLTEPLPKPWSEGYKGLKNPSTNGWTV